VAFVATRSAIPEPKFVFANVKRPVVVDDPTPAFVTYVSALGGACSAIAGAEASKTPVVTPEMNR
jgi:hypothetical protein